jgi:hypothetical protein
MTAGVVGAQYQLEVSSTSDFSNSAGGDYYFRSAALTTLTLQLPVGAELFDRSAFYWRIKVSTDAGATFLPATPPTRTFKVTSPAPAAPVLVSPITGFVSFANTVALDWNATVTVAGGPFTYEVDIATNATFTTGKQTLSAGTNTDDVTPTLAVGTYFWRVRAINALNVPGPNSLVRSFSVRAAAQPVLNLPADGATVTNAKQPLSWLAYAGAKRYELEYSQTSDFSGGVTTVTVNAPAVSGIPTASLKQSTWYWRVRAYDALVGGTASPDSAIRSLVVNIQNLPANNAIVTLVGAATNANITFSWIVVPGVTNYTLRYASDSAFTTDVQTVPVTTLSTAVPLPAGIYYWQVQAVQNGANGDPGFPPIPLISRKLTITPTAPVAPVLSTLPNNNVTSDNTPTFTWLASAAPSGLPFTYEIQVDTANTFPLPLIYGNTGISTLTDTVSPALADGVYYWRVRTINNLGIAGPFSLVFKFTVDTTAPTAPPTPTAPINGVTVTTPIPTLTWVATAGMGFVKYDISISNTNPPSNTPTAANLTVLSYKPASLLLVTTYYWKVRGYDAAGNVSAWSTVQTFKVGSATGAAPIPNRFTTSTPTLTWGPVSWAQSSGSYRIEVTNNTAFTGTPLYSATLPPIAGNVPQTATVSPALADGTYYWRVRACYDAAATNCGAWSGTGVFTVETAS